MSDRVTPEEDAALRRLHWFERYGSDLAPDMQSLVATIRDRDQRAEIREPGELGVPVRLTGEVPAEAPAEG